MLKKEKYREQVARWPRRGLHIPAQYDDKGVVVYQAYRQIVTANEDVYPVYDPEIAHHLGVDMYSPKAERSLA